LEANSPSLPEEADAVEESAAKESEPKCDELIAPNEDAEPAPVDGPQSVAAE
jgi:hypothetical protein